MAEIASQAGLDRTTTHRMLASLATQGLLSRVGEPRRYVLGPLTCQLGRIAAERVDLYKLSRPALTRLAAETRDTVFLMVRDGFEFSLRRARERHLSDQDLRRRCRHAATAGSRRRQPRHPDRAAAGGGRARDPHQRPEHRDLRGAEPRDAARPGGGRPRTGRTSMDVVRVPGVHAVAVPSATRRHAACRLQHRGDPCPHDARKTGRTFQLLEGEARRMTARLSGEFAA